VFAVGSALAEPRLADYGDVDTSAVTLRLPSGALVQIDSTRRTGYGYDEPIEVLGSVGMVEARRHRTGAVSRYGAGRVVDDGLHAGWFERVQPTYAAALAHFVAALERGEPITPSLDDGLEAHAIATVHVRSWRAAYRGLLPDDVLAGLSVPDREQLWSDRLTARPPYTRTVVAVLAGAIVGFAVTGPPLVPPMPVRGSSRPTKGPALLRPPRVDRHRTDPSRRGTARATTPARPRRPTPDRCVGRKGFAAPPSRPLSPMHRRVLAEPGDGEEEGLREQRCRRRETLIMYHADHAELRDTAAMTSAASAHRGPRDRLGPPTRAVSSAGPGSASPRRRRW
jgi:hypothetical protein